jgi:uncharacterized protein (TIGR03083 family)
MTMTGTVQRPPRRPALPRPTAMRLAATEYQRFVDLLCALAPDDWSKPTECPGWDVRDMAAHALGMVEMAVSVREQSRQVKAAHRRGGVFIDALTAVQVEERAEMSPRQIIGRFAIRTPKAARSRRWAPGLVRRRPLPDLQSVGGQDEAWTVGYLIDVILTRDPWMHRIDIVRATGAEHVLTADHDAVIVADVAAEWAQRHGQPYKLRLSGPAGGTWTSGDAGPLVQMDAVEFCRVLSGRGATGSGLLATQVPF